MKIDLFQWNVGCQSGSQYCVYDDDRFMPSNVFSPFETKFIELAHKIHMAIYERRLDAARRMINELSTIVNKDSLSIASSIPLGVFFSASL